MNQMNAVLAMFFITTLSPNAIAGETIIKSSNPFEKDDGLSIVVTTTNNTLTFEYCRFDSCERIGSQEAYDRSKLKAKLGIEAGKTGGAVLTDGAVALVSIYAVGITAIGVTAGYGASLTSVIVADTVVLGAESLAVSKLDFLSALNPFEHYRSFSTLRKAIKRNKKIVVKNIEDFRDDLEEVLDEI